VKSKVVPFNSVIRRKLKEQPVNRFAVQQDKLTSEAESFLLGLFNKSPEYIRNCLLELSLVEERICSTLFLSIARENIRDQKSMFRTAAALESLYLGLKAHRLIERNLKSDQIEMYLLAGDYCFSLALTLGVGFPVLIQGMAEIIARVVVGELGEPGQKIRERGLRSFLLQKISNTGASIFALSCSLGARYIGLPYQRNEALAFFGHYLGMARLLEQELIDTYAALLNRKNGLELSLPLAYILEYSTRKAELLNLIGKRKLSAGEMNLLIDEWNNVQPEYYIEKICKNFSIKASQFLSLGCHGLGVKKQLEAFIVMV
jgi:hypothetical protein